MTESESPAPPTEVVATEEEITTAAENSYGYHELDDLDLPPFRIGANKIRDRLSASSLQIPPGIQQKRYSLDSTNARARSRSRSPSWRSTSKERATLATSMDGNSSLSSLEEFVDPDILYDKLGFVELDPKEREKIKQQGSASSGQALYHQNSHSYTFGDNNMARPINLTPVSERMSEDTLEDVHAFSDVSANTRPSVGPSSSVGTGGSTAGGEVSSHVLEPLDEGDEDEDLNSDDDIGEAHHHGDKDHPHAAKHHHAQQVILTNLENITLHEDVIEEEETPQSNTGADDSPSLP